MIIYVKVHGVNAKYFKVKWKTSSNLTARTKVQTQAKTLSCKQTTDSVIKWLSI